MFLHFRFAPIAAFGVLLLSYTDSHSAPRSPVKASAPKTTVAATKASPPLRLKSHAFPDVTMGVPAAYTVMLPPDWSATGNIEWMPVGEVPFPQQKFQIDSPQKGRISYQPMMTMGYLESSMTGREGVAPPANFPQWLASAAATANPKLGNVKLVKSSRDEKSEAFIKQIERDTGGPSGMEQEVHNIVLEYDEDGVRRREEVNLTYVRYAPYRTSDMYSQMWSISHGGSFSAPVNTFAAQRASLLKVASTVRPTPQWHIQSQKVIAEMSRQRTANNWEAIRQRGQQLNQVSDSDYAKFKKDMTGGDAAQRQRVNSIYETDDFKDTNGNIVNLPMHYQHIFSDGKGNYVLSNNSGDKPGAQWKPIQRMK